MYTNMCVEIVTFSVAFIFYICAPSPGSILAPSPEPVVNGFNSWLYVTFIAKDSQNLATCFPSEHIIFLFSPLLVSFFFLKKDWKTILQTSLCFVFFIAVGASVLLIKQHFVADVIGALVLVAIAYVVLRLTKCFVKVELLFNKLYDKLKNLKRS
ncbi:MAG: phosphatase PAP2 family protein [Mycoplasmataceae bacterium]|nr:phosphatase PAP2 family protein [Mycoplasmataceae bacterium]